MIHHLYRIGVGILMGAALLLTSCVEEDWECPDVPQAPLQEEIDVPDWDDDIHQHV
jgi:hypothetical protein